MRNFYRDFYLRNFKLGALYSFHNRVYKFIKTTPKGFNLLNLETNRCLFKRQLFSREWSNKEIPEPIDIVKNVTIPNTVIFKEIPIFVGK